MAQHFDFPSPFLRGDKVHFSFTSDDASNGGFGSFNNYSVQMDIVDLGGDVHLSFSSDASTIWTDSSTLLFTMDSSSFGELQRGNYKYDIQLKDANGDCFTLLYGGLNVKDDQTK